MIDQRHSFRPLLLALALLGGTLAAPAEAAPPPEGVEALLAKEACETLVLTYASAWDHGDADAFANLFAPDGTLTFARPIEGREAIRKTMEAGSARSTFRHVMSNIQITLEDADTARGVSYAIVLTGPRPEGEATGPVALEGLGTVGEYHDVFVRTDEGWKIAARRFVPILRAAPPAPRPAE
ncbi:MAG: nuclear transport factor 2 family protein [Alphaproteobacteria bacterium]|nr:nuclear transport factor 2 family protein [Alphaproteobacteria bacterium]